MSKHHHERSIPLFLVGLAGLLVSVLAGIFEHVPSIQFLCSAACRETAEISLLWIPLWVWGAVFWAAVAVLAWFKGRWAISIAAPAAGLEAALVWIMFRMGAPCVFCIANAVMVAVFVAFSLRKALLWQQSALALLFLLSGASWIPIENGLFASNAPQNGGAGQTEIAARVGDETITDHRLEVLLGSKLLELKKEIYRLKRDKLDQLINESVIQKEAREKGQTIEKFLDDVVPASNFAATDQEIDKYLQDNQERVKEWQGTMAELRVRVKAFLEQHKRVQGVNAYAHANEKKYGVQVYLPVPQLPNVTVNITGLPSQGLPDAPVTIVEFSDYECPACRSTHQVVQKVKETYGNKIRWVFNDFPLRRHKDAFKAAEAAHCAADHGKFWEYQDVVFTRDKLDLESLVKYAVELGLPADSFRNCLQKENHKEAVEKNIKGATNAGIDRTPSFIINGALFTGGHAFETFKTKIDEELKKVDPKH